MYRVNCTETADESNSRSRQIAYERANIVKNALSAWKTLGTKPQWVQRFSKEAK